MSELKADPTLKQIVDAINTQRDVDIINSYIKSKLNLNGCEVFPRVSAQLCFELGMDKGQTNCSFILAIIEDYFKALEREKEEKEAEQVLNEYGIQVNPIPNTPEHA